MHPLQPWVGEYSPPFPAAQGARRSDQASSAEPGAGRSPFRGVRLRAHRAAGHQPADGEPPPANPVRGRTPAAREARCLGVLPAGAAHPGPGGGPADAAPPPGPPLTRTGTRADAASSQSVERVIAHVITRIILTSILSPPAT